MNDQNSPENSENPTPQQPQKPEYGEYAPGFPAEPQNTEPQNSGPTQTDQSATQKHVPSRLEGVPHNLGISKTAATSSFSPPAQTPPGNTTPTQPQSTQPPSTQIPPAHAPAADTTEEAAHQEPEQRPAVPTAPATPPQRQQTAFNATSMRPAQPPRSNLKADRIVTIILLAVGAFGALNLAMGAMDISRQLYLIADAVGVTDINIPSAVKTIETTTAILILSIYAVTLLWSVHRLRNKRLTFWVPLLGAVVAFLALTIAMAVGFAMVPEVMNNVTPENFDSILNSLMTP